VVIFRYRTSHAATQFMLPEEPERVKPARKTCLAAAQGRSAVPVISTSRKRTGHRERVERAGSPEPAYFAER
jgi:hypothetical protein